MYRLSFKRVELFLCFIVDVDMADNLKTINLFLHKGCLDKREQEAFICYHVQFHRLRANFSELDAFTRLFSFLCLNSTQSRVEYPPSTFIIGKVFSVAHLL